MGKTKLEMNLTPLDDIFSTQEERTNANLEKVVDIKISEIDDFKEHPFKVKEDDELKAMENSISDKGVLVPVIVRQKKDGRYEMISGHRRKKACQSLKLDTIPCIVRNLTDNEATIIMVDSNLQREKILPSEKAFAYKMKYEAMKHQGKRTDLTSGQVDQKTTAEQLGKESKESEKTVRRYIRLTNLLPKLLEYVDNSVIKDKVNIYISLSPAVEISFLTQEEQASLLDYIDCNQITPSHAQAIELKEMSQNGTFTVEKMQSLLNTLKPNQTPKLGVSMNRLSHVLPKTLKNDREREEYVIKAVEWYDKYQKRLKERNTGAR